MYGAVQPVAVAVRSIVFAAIHEVRMPVCQLAPRLTRPATLARFPYVQPKQSEMRRAAPLL